MTKQQLLEHSYRGKSFTDRFWSKITKSDSGCWLFTGKLDIGGYGRMSVGPDWVFVHRASWMLHNSDIPDGLYVLHRCDVRNCVNPDHLWLGTYADNNADARQKGRSFLPKGSQVGTSKLTENDILTIRETYRSGGFTQKEIADIYRVTDTCIKLIIDGKSWKHVGGPIGNTKTQERLANGQISPFAKLTTEKVQKIRELYKHGQKPSKIAKDFAVSCSAIHRLIAGKTYSHIREPMQANDRSAVP